MQDQSTSIYFFLYILQFEIFSAKNTPLKIIVQFNYYKKKKNQIEILGVLLNRNPIFQNILILLTSTAVLSRPVPNPTPISVYQQGSGEQQEYQQQQYTQPLQYKQQLVPQVRSAAAPLYKGQPEQNPSLLQQTQTEDYEVRNLKINQKKKNPKDKICKPTLFQVNAL